MASESAAQTDGNKKKLIRKPNDFLWTGTSLVIIYAVSIPRATPALFHFCFVFFAVKLYSEASVAVQVWCILLLILTASGHLLNSHSFGCINTEEVKPNMFIIMFSTLQNESMQDSVSFGLGCNNLESSIESYLSQCTEAPVCSIRNQ